MKAIRIHEDGGPEVLRYEDAPDPEPGPDEVLVELRAASLNHLDLWIRSGRPSVPKPRILGADGAGIADGERVLINPGIEHGEKITVIGEHMDGTHAELIAVPRANVYPIPDGMSFEEAAAWPLVFETAYRMLVTKAGLREGEWVLIWGIGGGLATAANAIARALGAQDDRDLVERREARAGRGRREGRPRLGGRRRGRARQRPTAAARTSSSSTSARRRGSERSRRPAPAGGSRSAVRRAARTRPRRSTGSGGSS